MGVVASQMGRLCGTCLDCTDPASATAAVYLPDWRVAAIAWALRLRRSGLANALPWVPWRGLFEPLVLRRRYTAAKQARRSTVMVGAKDIWGLLLAAGVGSRRDNGTGRQSAALGVSVGIAL